MKRDSKHALLVVLLLASVAYHLTRVVLSISDLADPNAYPKAPFTLEPVSPVVAAVDDPSTGLEVGDEILRVGDRPLRGYGDLGLALVGAGKTGSLSVVVARPEGPVPLEVPLPPPSAAPLRWVRSVSWFFWISLCLCSSSGLDSRSPG